MKRKTITSLIICGVLMVILVLGIVFRYDIFYGFTSLRTIKIDTENTTDMYQYSITKFDDVRNNFEVNNTATIN